jgi:hypothetical protein
VCTLFEIRLEDRFQHELGGGLNHPILYGRDAAFAAPGLGIITRRTGAGRYVFEPSSSRMLASHKSTVTVPRDQRERSAFRTRRRPSVRPRGAGYPARIAVLAQPLNGMARRIFA